MIQSNDMCIISLRDITKDKYHYEYRGKLPKKYIPAYEFIIQQLGLDIEFKGIYTDECPKTYISHCCKVALDFEIFGYRRAQVRDYIKKNFKDYMILSTGIVEPKYIVVSDPRVAIIELIEKITLGNAVTFIYDKTDKWESLEEIDAKLDALCLQYADIITYSAYGLCPIEYKNKAHYVPNGNNFYAKPKVDKYERPTAIYAGNNIEKFNGQVLYVLAERYPEWDFKVYINHEARTEECMVKRPPNVEFYMPIPQERLFKEICKCHVGLLLFYNNQWTSGMLPLKLFNYINAEIPTLYSSLLENNLQDYGEVAFSITDCTLNDLLSIDADYNKYKREWADVIKELTGIWRIEDET